MTRNDLQIYYCHKHSLFKSLIHIPKLLYIFINLPMYNKLTEQYKRKPTNSFNRFPNIYIPLLLQIALKNCTSSLGYVLFFHLKQPSSVVLKREILHFGEHYPFFFPIKNPFFFKSKFARYKLTAFKILLEHNWSLEMKSYQP